MVHAETVFYGVDHPKKAYYIKGLGLVLGGVLRHPPRRSKVKGQKLVRMIARLSKAKLEGSFES